MEKVLLQRRRVQNREAGHLRGVRLFFISRLLIFCRNSSIMGVWPRRQAYPGSARVLLGQAVGGPLQPPSSTLPPVAATLRGRSSRQIHTAGSSSSTYGAAHGDDAATNALNEQLDILIRTALEQFHGMVGLLDTLFEVGSHIDDSRIESRMGANVWLLRCERWTSI